MKQNNFCSYEVLFWLYIQIMWDNTIICPKSYMCHTRVWSMTPEFKDRDLKKNTIVVNNTGKKWLSVWLECPENEWEKEHVEKVQWWLFNPKK